MKREMLSIIVPAYNCENTIVNCIESILQSTYSQYELIIINDASVDNTASVLKQYEEYDKVQIINLSQNKGVSYCRNLGIDKAKGGYITFVDADDYITKEMYERMMKATLSSNVDCCVCDYSEIYSNNNVQKSKYKYKNIVLSHDEVIKSYLTDQISPAVWDKIFKTEILKKKVKFNEGLKVGEDILFCLNFFTNCRSLYTLNEIHYFYIQQTNSVMHTISPKLLQFEEVVTSIPQQQKKYYKDKYLSEYNYFQSAMLLRGIHSISVLYNQNNKSQVKEYLSKLRKKDLLDLHLKNKYTSKFIKLEIVIFRYLGISFHLLLMPVYKSVRKVLRKAK